jgi:hypothetical protein
LWRDFATTLPELFAAMCFNQQIERERSASRRSDSFSWRPMTTHNPGTVSGTENPISDADRDGQFTDRQQKSFELSAIRSDLLIVSQ